MTSGQEGGQQGLPIGEGRSDESLAAPPEAQVMAGLEPEGQGAEPYVARGSRQNSRRGLWGSKGAERGGSRNSQSENREHKKSPLL